MGHSRPSARKHLIRRYYDLKKKEQCVTCGKKSKKGKTRCTNCTKKAKENAD